MAAYSIDVFQLGTVDGNRELDRFEYLTTAGLKTVREHGTKDPVLPAVRVIPSLLFASLFIHSLDNTSSVSER